jgi:two-component system, cell cycle sensor histidine kinase and response regulator CckA
MARILVIDDHVDSEPGAGTVFEVYLPLIDQAVENREKPIDENPPGGKETVLVTDDNDQVRMFIKVVLSDYGYRVIEANDGDEAVRLFEESPEAIDLLALDMLMPGRDGKSAFDAVKGVRSDVWAVFMSGHTWETFRERRVAEVELPFLQKPLKPNELVNMVRETLDEPVGKRRSEEVW